MKIYNVVSDYDWTSMPRQSSMRSKAPTVLLKAYKVNSSQSLKRLRNYVQTLANTNPEDFYNKLYGDVTSEEAVYIIPFFGDAVRSFSNEYGDAFQAGFLNGIDSAFMGASKLVGEIATYKPIENLSNIGNASKNAVNDLGSGGNISDVGRKLLSDINSGVSTAPGSYIETPKLYQYAQNDSGLEISFVLSNTINGDYNKNVELVNNLTTINRPKRINSVVMEPPRIYEVKLKGIRYIKWAYCSNFSVTLLGTRRVIDEVIIPEGYLINLTMTSLTTEVSNFMDNI